MKRKTMVILLLVLAAIALPAAAQEWVLTEETIRGAWACAGARDANPYLVFFPDGICDIYDYAFGDEESEEENAFPGVFRERAAYVLGDGTLTLSCFDTPLEVELITAAEEMETTMGEPIAQGTEGLILYEYVETVDGLIPMEYVYFRMDVIPDSK